MSETPEDISLPSQEAGVIFRAEMASQNFILGYWKVLVGIVVAVLVAILVYGQYTGYVRNQQRGFAADIAKIEVPITDIQRTLAMAPSEVVESDRTRLQTAAESLMAVGASAWGPAAAEAYMKAAELHRMLGNTEAQLAAYEAAIPAAEGDVEFAAKAARAALLLDTGANEASAITFAGDVMVNGTRVPAGTYGLFTIPGDTWTVIFNTTAEQWGSMNYDEAADQARVMAEPITDAPMQEQFEIRFADVTEDSATMILHWGTVGVPVTITEAGM